MPELGTFQLRGRENQQDRNETTEKTAADFVRNLFTKRHGESTRNEYSRHWEKLKAETDKSDKTNMKQEYQILLYLTDLHTRGA